MSRLSTQLVACNIYLSAGRANHAQMLFDILTSSQERCRQLRKGLIRPSSQSHFVSSHNDDSTTTRSTTSENTTTSRQGRQYTGVLPAKQIAIVHAYADQPYDRSSFHLAGHADCIADLASYLASHALEAVLSLPSSSTSSNESKHPTVGVIDHISIMPLSYSPLPQHNHTINNNKNSDQTTTPPSSTPFTPDNAHGLAATYVSQILSQNCGVRVYPYGHAHPENLPLATVRRDRTNFFHPSASCTPLETPQPTPAGVCTVGAPQSFVENYNIRLTPGVTERDARRLTRMVRERDGGVVGVEALTLPYSDGRFEVACNLLQVGNGGTAEEVERRLSRWVEEMAMAGGGGGNGVELGRGEFVEEGYRVGTTVDQCQAVMGGSGDEGVMDAHDSKILDQLRSYLLR